MSHLLGYQFTRLPSFSAKLCFFLVFFFPGDLFKICLYKIENCAMWLFLTGFLTWSYPGQNILLPYLVQMGRKNIRCPRFYYQPSWYNLTLVWSAQVFCFYFKVVLCEFLVIIPRRWLNSNGIFLLLSLWSVLISVAFTGMVVYSYCSSVFSFENKDWTNE